MLRSTARRKVTWGATIIALVVGLALLLMLTNPSFHPKPAQAQTAPAALLNIDGAPNAEFIRFDEATSSIQLPRSDGSAAKLAPVRIVLERGATNSLVLSSWHRQASTQLTGYRNNATLTFFDSSGNATVKLFLKSAWPAEYQLEQQDDQVVERVTLTAAYFERVAP